MKLRQLPSGSWNAQVYIKNKYVSVTAKTKKECEIKIGELKKNGIKDFMTVGDALDKYIEMVTPVCSPLTIAGYKRTRKYSFQDLMKMDVRDLTDRIVQNEINKEILRPSMQTGKTISAKTVKNNFSVIASALKEQGYQFRSKLPKVHHTNEYLPEPYQVINAIKGTDIELPCLLAMWMSLRQAEIVALTKDSINGDFLTINKTRNFIDGKDTIKPYAKTDSSMRTLKMPPYIKELIQDQISDNDLIFPYTGNALHHKFRKLMKEHNIKIRFHDLRHLFASVSLTILGIPSKQVQKEGGWSSPSVMEKVYSQTFTSIDQESFTRRNEYFEKIMHP